MPGTDRWRKWRPAEEEFDTTAKRELPKLTEPISQVDEGSFVSSGSSNFRQTPNFSGMAHHDHEAWSGDFAIWMKERCVHREGRDDRGGIGVMLLDFAEWAMTHDSVPCTRQTFETLLLDAGFLVANGMACGLFLKADLWAIEPQEISKQSQSSRERTNTAENL
jgi:hypothetical protein